jgi:DNA-binding NtrC family response regulator
MREPTEVKRVSKPLHLYDEEPGSSGHCHPLTRISSEFPKWLESYFLGRHPAVRETRAAILRAAAESWPVLVTGETGTGKDMVARAIHHGSSRRDKLPEVVAVGGLGETSWSVLFGHRKGSFTGAVSDHDGVFRSANGSSILLEDVSDLPLRVQPMLLRAIEHGLFRPLGSDREIHSDVRVIATSNVHLDREVGNGRFRADLYQRLSVLTIELPPLRDHLEDLEVYVPFFLAKAAAAHRPAKRITTSALAALAEYAWPRNIRELEHFLYRVSVEVHGNEIGAEDIRRFLRKDLLPAPRPRRPRPSRVLNRDAIVRTLRETNGNKREAARKLNVAPATLYSLIKRHRIDEHVGGTP